jgi:hypothetical protein
MVALRERATISLRENEVNLRGTVSKGEMMLGVEQRLMRPLPR